ncbi:hypothetical protein PAMP_019122 [Pampus punctatissimus]
MERADSKYRDSDSAEPVTELGSDFKLVCRYPSSVSVEETLSMWTNFWRSALSGFSQFNRRHNTIQYNNNRDTVRDLEYGSLVHIFHSMLVTLLNTSGVTFTDSLSGRLDASLMVNDIMLTRDSLHPTAYRLLLANKLGLGPSDVKCKVKELELEWRSRFDMCAA